MGEIKDGSEEKMAEVGVAIRIIGDQLGGELKGGFQGRGKILEGLGRGKGPLHKAWVLSNDVRLKEAGHLKEAVAGKQDLVPALLPVKDEEGGIGLNEEVLLGLQVVTGHGDGSLSP